MNSRQQAISSFSSVTRKFYNIYLSVSFYIATHLPNFFGHLFFMFSNNALTFL